jgi:hypothetical protein
MKKDLLKLIMSIKPEFDSDSNFNNPLPNSASIYLKDEKHLIDISLVDDVLEVRIKLNGRGYNIGDEDIKVLYNHLNECLKYQIELTKQYYLEESYYRQRGLI